ncbi:MAG: pilus assembly protein PilP [Pseudomonadota bacterium]
MRNDYGRYFIVLILTAALTVSGCSERKRLRDLEQYVAQLKQSSQLPTKASLLKDLQPPTPVTYMATNPRSPFEASSSAGGSNRVVSKHPLQNYPVAQLHFKGTVTQGDNTWAFVLAPDNKLYQVKLGDMIGDHYGKIVNISQTSLTIQEQIDQLVPLGKPETKIVTLQLKGPS